MNTKYIKCQWHNRCGQMAQRRVSQTGLSFCDKHFKKIAEVYGVTPENEKLTRKRHLELYYGR